MWKKQCKSRRLTDMRGGMMLIQTSNKTMAVEAGKNSRCYL
ncbi:MAG: hypothetical protein N3D76_08480 [Geminocystis sp.]|nr:hypothetical protein [Geminocystis sp.]